MNPTFLKAKVNLIMHVDLYLFFNLLTCHAVVFYKNHSTSVSISLCIHILCLNWCFIGFAIVIWKLYVQERKKLLGCLICFFYSVIHQIFTLSAIPLQTMPVSIKECFSVLKPGGLLLFRDYGNAPLKRCFKLEFLADIGTFGSFNISCTC